MFISSDSCRFKHTAKYLIYEKKSEEKKEKQKNNGKITEPNPFSHSVSILINVFGTIIYQKKQRINYSNKHKVFHIIFQTVR